MSGAEDRTTPAARLLTVREALIHWRETAEALDELLEQDPTLGVEVLRAISIAVDALRAVDNARQAVRKAVAP